MNALHQQGKEIVESRLKRDLGAIYQIPTLPPDSAQAIQSDQLRIPLFPYQLRSLHRMIELEEQPSLGRIAGKDITTAGGVVADVVGMGKTAQIIALLLARPVSNRHVA